MNHAPLHAWPTRYARNTDADTSHEAARHALGGKAAAERRAIRAALQESPMTAREVAAFTGISYIEVQRRIGECMGIERTKERRDGCAVWRAK